MPRTVFALALLATLSTGCSGSGAAPARAKQEDAGAYGPSEAVRSVALAQEAFIWGYPLVVSLRTFQTIAGLLGTNTLLNQTAFANPATRFIVSPNQDTVYSVAVLDLRSEPMVLSVPDVQDRYFV